MTLQQLFDYLSTHYLVTGALVLFPPITAAFANWIGRGRGYEEPWRTVNSVLLYAACIPGVLAVGLLAYLVLFESISVLEIDLLPQVAPIVGMIATIIIIQRSVDLQYLPGFGRLSGLVVSIAALMMLLYLADRFRLVAFTYLPAVWVILGFVLILLALQWGLRRGLRG